MSKLSVSIIDYGVGNLLSVARGLERCGAKVTITSNPKKILSSFRVVLPGVGAFSNGMKELKKNNLDEVVREVADKEVPLLGICLGMQMLLDESEEFGKTKGLGLISGKVIPIPTITIDGNRQKIPHIGWNSLKLSKNYQNWKKTPLAKVQEYEEVYFTHSFMANPSSSKYRLADCLYGGLSIAAFIKKNNIFGCQFHPEKSGKVGLKILKSFINM
jgi:imidazole glycerol-phosphate synthase subunit HisH